MSVYLDLKLTEVTRRQMLLHMCQACLDDMCWACHGEPCKCGCNDNPAGQPPARCRRCGYWLGMRGHRGNCDRRAAIRLHAIADSIGGAA